MTGDGDKTTVSCLTPPGVGAIATLAIVGPQSWDAIRRLYHGSRPLPQIPATGKVWHGWLGDQIRDQVTIWANPQRREDWIEVHCHGGSEVIRQLMLDLERLGIAQRECSERSGRHDLSPLRTSAQLAIPSALTLRTADILLWQWQGALENALLEIQAALCMSDASRASGLLQRLTRHSCLGRHLTRPWRLVIAGAPNAGKSSLMNALAGHQRSIVAPTAGTTRDVVKTLLAFDGWPVAVADTAGIRLTTDELEQAGVERAWREVMRADLCLWLLDSSSEPVWPTSSPGNLRFVINKIDLPATWDVSRVERALMISARTGQGIPELSQAISCALVPQPPRPCEAVPFSDSLCVAIELAANHLSAANIDQARDVIDSLISGEYCGEALQDA